MPKYEGLEDGDLILIDPDTGKTLRLPAQKVKNLELDLEPEGSHIKHAVYAIEEDMLGKDIIYKMKKKINEWIKK